MDTERCRTSRSQTARYIGWKEVAQSVMHKALTLAPHMLPTPRAVDVASSVWPIGPQATTIICGCECESPLGLAKGDISTSHSESLVGRVDIFIEGASGTGHD